MQKFTEAKQSEGEVLKDNTQPPKSAYPKKEITDKKEEVSTEPDSRQSPVGEVQKEEKQNTASAEVANNGEHTFNHYKTTTTNKLWKLSRRKSKEEERCAQLFQRRTSVNRSLVCQGAC